ncbi:hypothetical protein ACFXDH_53965 [Streptomyces sp. NPDC059467]
MSWPSRRGPRTLRGGRPPYDHGLFGDDDSATSKLRATVPALTD